MGALQPVGVNVSECNDYELEGYTGKKPFFEPEKCNAYPLYYPTPEELGPERSNPCK